MTDLEVQYSLHFYEVNTSHFKCLSANLFLFPQLDSPAVEKMHSTGVEDADIVKTSIARVASKGCTLYVYVLLLDSKCHRIHMFWQGVTRCYVSLQFLFTWLFLTKLLVFLKSPL